MVTKLFKVVTCCKVRCCLVVEAGNRQGADLVAETPKHDPLIINIRSSDCLKNLYISILMRFIGNKLGRLLTIGRIFSTQTLKSSPISCWFLVRNKIFKRPGFYTLQVTSVFSIFPHIKQLNEMKNTCEYCDNFQLWSAWVWDPRKLQKTILGLCFFLFLMTMFSSTVVPKVAS